MKTVQEIWIDFACASISRQHETDKAARDADVMLAEFDRRYGQAAILLAGIYDCAICEQPIKGVYLASDGKDGEFKKFCMPCVEKVKEASGEFPITETDKKVVSPAVFKCSVCAVPSTHLHPDLGPVCETHSK